MEKKGVCYPLQRSLLKSKQDRVRRGAREKTRKGRQEGGKGGRKEGVCYPLQRSLLNIRELGGVEGECESMTRGRDGGRRGKYATLFKVHRLSKHKTATMFYNLCCN